VRIGRAAEKLERDLAIELRIPRAVDVAEGAACDVIENVEVPPASGRPWSCGPATGYPCGLNPVNLRDAGDDPQRRHLAAKGVAADLLERVPVDRRTLADRADQVLEGRTV